MDGDVRLNGKKTNESMCYLSGFMYQEDFFIGALTVREHLSFMVGYFWLILSTNVCKIRTVFFKTKPISTVP